MNNWGERGGDEYLGDEIFGGDSCDNETKRGVK